MTDSHGKFYWNELMAHDVAKAKKFYADTLGWSFDAMPMPGGGTYWLAKMGDEPVGEPPQLIRARPDRAPLKLQLSVDRHVGHHHRQQPLVHIDPRDPVRHNAHCWRAQRACFAWL